MDGKRLGREIARAVSAQMLQDDMVKAMAGHVARVATIDLFDMLAQAGAFAGSPPCKSFATGGLVTSSRVRPGPMPVLQESATAWPTPTKPGHVLRDGSIMAAGIGPVAYGIVWVPKDQFGPALAAGWNGTGVATNDGAVVQVQREPTR